MACPGLRRPSSQARYPLRTGVALGSAKPIAMRCSHGNLDAVAASGTPNPRKVATSNTPAVCAVNEPADQWRQPAWPGIRWTGFPKAKPAAGIQVRLSSATHHDGDEIAAQPRPRYFKMAPTAHQKEPANVVSTRGWQNSQLCTAAAAAC